MATSSFTRNFILSSDAAKKIKENTREFETAQLLDLRDRRKKGVEELGVFFAMLDKSRENK